MNPTPRRARLPSHVLLWMAGPLLAGGLLNRPAWAGPDQQAPGGFCPASVFLPGLLAQAGPLGPPPNQPKGNPQPPKPKLKDNKQGTSKLVLYGGGGVGLVMVIFFVAVFLKGKETSKKRVGGVQATENQIDNYRLLNLMMTGQTSQVWEVSELSSGRHFALKMLLPEHVKSQDQRFFLFHEAEVGRQIIHPKIIKILEVIKDRDHPYIIMEFFPSKNLKLRLMHKEGPFIKENLRIIVEQTGTALAFMHEKGWIHRDVKPDNILINSAAEVRLIDFALAQRASKPKGMFGRKKGGGKAQGTRSYMSPEQIRGEGLDPRADMYSFGTTLFELITGRTPFTANSPQDLLTKQIAEKAVSPQVYNPDVSDEVSDLLLRMLAKKRDDRPRDFHDFLMKFRSIRVLFKSQAPKPQAARKKEG